MIDTPASSIRYTESAVDLVAPTSVAALAATPDYDTPPQEEPLALAMDFLQAGLERESGVDVISTYLQTKNIWINTGAPTGNPFVIR